MAKILLVEDEINIASFIERGLQEFGHEVRVANDGQAGWELVQQEDFHLLILDIIMPKMNGLQLCKQYRQAYGYQSPVIMLTALGTTDDIVNGLDAGADDYLAKPFGMMELISRVNALLRRASRPSQGAAEEVAEPSDLMAVGAIKLSPSARTVVANGREVNLTRKEFDLLRTLMENKGRVLTREQLLEQVWGVSFVGETRTVDMHVKTLRRKLAEAAPGSEEAVATVRGVGYRLKKNAS